MKTTMAKLFRRLADKMAPIAELPPAEPVRVFLSPAYADRTDVVLLSVQATHATVVEADAGGVVPQIRTVDSGETLTIQYQLKPVKHRV